MSGGVAVSLLIAFPGPGLFGAAPAAVKLQVIRSLESASGMNPSALVAGTDGKLYGTMEAGGSKGEGVVYQLFSFGPIGGGAHGGIANPRVVVVNGKDKTLYGTTTSGGTSNVVAIYRVVF